MVPIPLAQAPVAEGTLNVRFVSQEHYRNLCWAACTAMVTSTAARENPSAYGHLPATVLGVATDVLAANLGGHCAPGPQDGVTPFDRACFPDCAIKGALNLTCSLRTGTLEQQALLDEIGKSGHPPILLLMRNDGSTHVILLSGYRIYHDGTVYFDVCDPLLEGVVAVLFSQLLQYNSSYAHQASWQWTYIDVGPVLKVG